MVPKLLIATGLALAFALPAAAQSQSGNSLGSRQQSPANSQNNQGNMNIRQHLTQDLQKAGFTDVHVMPESFLVRAKDKQGEPVMMVINPDSMTALTEVGAAGQSGSSTGKSKTQ